MIEVIKGGLLTTIQDAGRVGYRHLGIPESGYMDDYNAPLANWLVDNPLTFPLLEITMSGPTLKIHNEHRLAVTGGNIRVKINDQEINVYETFNVFKGDVLSFGTMNTGYRAYLSVAGGFLGEEFLNSHSTYVPGNFGGLKGRALEPGDHLQVNPVKSRANHRSVPEYLRTNYSASRRIRFIEGPEFEYFLDESPMGVSGSYTIDHKSDRMGIRLTGFSGELIEKEIISSPVCKGTIQVLPDNNLIVLMNDGQVTGGYPRIGVIIKADLHLMAQVKAGDHIQLMPVTHEEATSLNHYRMRLLNNLQTL